MCISTCRLILVRIEVEYWHKRQWCFGIGLSPYFRVKNKATEGSPFVGPNKEKKTSKSINNLSDCEPFCTYNKCQ